jgi:hypothetical protein
VALEVEPNRLAPDRRRYSARDGLFRDQPYRPSRASFRRRPAHHRNQRALSGVVEQAVRVAARFVAQRVLKASRLVSLANASHLAQIRPHLPPDCRVTQILDEQHEDAKPPPLSLRQSLLQHQLDRSPVRRAEAERLPLSVCRHPACRSGSDPTRNTRSINRPWSEH